MQWLVSQCHSLWDEVSGDAKWDFLKWIWAGDAMTTFGLLHGLSWQVKIPLFLGIGVLGTIALLLVCSVQAAPLLRIRGVPARVLPRQTGEAAGVRSICEIEVHNATSKSLENIRCEVIAIELPSGLGLRAPSGFIVELHPTDDTRVSRLMPGANMRFVLLDDAWLVEAFGKTTVVAKRVGSWGGLYGFPLGESRLIGIKVMAENVPAQESVYSITVEPKVGRFSMKKLSWWSRAARKFKTISPE